MVTPLKVGTLLIGLCKISKKVSEVSKIKFISSLLIPCKPSRCLDFNFTIFLSSIGVESSSNPMRFDASHLSIICVGAEFISARFFWLRQVQHSTNLF